MSNGSLFYGYFLMLMFQYSLTNLWVSNRRLSRTHMWKMPVSVFSDESLGEQRVDHLLAIRSAVMFQYSLTNLWVSNNALAHTPFIRVRFQYSLTNLWVSNGLADGWNLVGVTFQYSLTNLWVSNTNKAAIV